MPLDMTRRLPNFLIALLLLVCVMLETGCSSGRADAYDPRGMRDRVLARVPPSWSLAAPTDQQREYMAMYFRGPRTEAFLLNGPRSNSIYWIDKAGRRHPEDLARECLYVWIVPAHTRPPSGSWNPKSGQHPKCLHSSRRGKVYGIDSQYITDTARFDEIMGMDELVEVGSPNLRLSWRTWRNDIASSVGE